MIPRRRPARAAASAAGVLALLGALLGALLVAATAAAGGPPFPAPNGTQSIYDPDRLLRPATVTTAERAADGLVASIDLRPIIYVERSPAALSASQAGRNADALVKQWGVTGGLVMLVDVGAKGCGGLVTVRRGSTVDPRLATDEALASVEDTAAQFLAGCDPDTAVLVGLNNLSATLVSLSIGDPLSSASAGSAGPGASVRPFPTPSSSTVPAGPPFPDPVPGRYVYDQAGVFGADTISKVQAQIQAIRDRTGAEIVVYSQVVGPVVTEAQAESHAQALMDQWGVGRRGFDDGLVILYDLDTSRVHGQVQLYAGPGYRAAFLSNGERQSIFEDDMLPLLQEGDLDGALLAAMAKVDANATPEHADTLNRARIANAIIGLAGAPIVLLLLVAWPLLHWFRYGRDPDFLDDPSIYMRAPPPDLTAAAGALVFDGRSSRHTLTTALLDLASRDEIAFRPEAQRLAKDRMDIEIRQPDEDDPRIALNRRRPISPAEIYARSALTSLATPDEQGVPMVDSTELLQFGSKVSGFDDKLELYATQKGWFATAPKAATTRWAAHGIAEICAGGAVVIVALSLPSDGLLLVGGAGVVAGVITLLLARAMPARTLAGATIRAMLAAYRRTLQKTMALSRSMDQVVASKALPWLETPDQAVVWGVALGLREDVGDVLARTADDVAHGHANPAGTYLPAWYGGRGWSGSTGGGGSGIAPGLFSGSAIPNFGGMMAAIGTVGNSPSSSGGGFGGGGSGGGGGGAGGGF